MVADVLYNGFPADLIPETYLGNTVQPLPFMAGTVLLIHFLEKDSNVLLSPCTEERSG